MDASILKSLEDFIQKANVILEGNMMSAYCFGSAVYEDFQDGYSDLDFFIIVDTEITDAIFKKFSMLRKHYKSLNHPYLSVLEGKIIATQGMSKDKEANVIYWGLHQID